MDRASYRVASTHLKTFFMNPLIQYESSVFSSAPAIDLTIAGTLNVAIMNMENSEQGNQAETKVHFF